MCVQARVGLLHITYIYIRAYTCSKVLIHESLHEVLCLVAKTNGIQNSHSHVLFKALTNESGNFRDNAQVDAVGRKHDLSVINVMVGRVGNPIGGTLNAPVTNANI